MRRFSRGLRTGMGDTQAMRRVAAGCPPQAHGLTKDGIRDNDTGTAFLGVNESARPETHCRGTTTRHHQVVLRGHRNQCGQ